MGPCSGSIERGARCQCVVSIFWRVGVVKYTGCGLYTYSHKESEAVFYGFNNTLSVVKHTKDIYPLTLLLLAGCY